MNRALAILISMIFVTSTASLKAYGKNKKPKGELKAEVQPQKNKKSKKAKANAAQPPMGYPPEDDVTGTLDDPIIQFALMMMLAQGLAQSAKKGKSSRSGGGGSFSPPPLSFNGVGGGGQGQMSAADANAALKSATCNGIPDEVNKAATECMDQAFAAGQLNQSCEHRMILDGDSQVLYLLDKSNQCVASARGQIGHASKTGGNANTPGNVSGGNKTPAGLLKTAPYDGSVFSSATAIDLRGLEPGKNDKASARGIVFHGSSKNTRGCIGCDPRVFQAFKQKITTGGCPLYNYFKKDANDCRISGKNSSSRSNIPQDRQQNRTQNQ